LQLGLDDPYLWVCTPLPELGDRSIDDVCGDGDEGTRAAAALLSELEAARDASD
jgi:hypothetical protein